MANGAYDDGILRIGPPAPPPAPGRGGRYCAEASLVLAVLGLMCIFLGVGVHVDFPPIGLIVFVCMALAFVLALIGRRQSGEARVIANFTLLLVCPTVLLLCLLPHNSGGPHGAARRAQFTNNMKQVGLALDNYRLAHGRFPPAIVRDPEGRPLYSWRVLILPYLESTDLYREFHLDERWDSPHNRSLLGEAPFAYCGIGVDGGRVRTYIQAFVGPGTAFESAEGEPFDNPDGSSNFPDGAGNTILAVEARESVPWSAPFDLPFGPDLAMPALGGGYRGDRGWMESQPKIKDFAVLFADTSVKTKPWPIASETLRAWVTRNGGEAVPADSRD